MFSKVSILIQMLFMIHETQIHVRIMEHVTVCRVMQLVFVHQILQDRHVQVIYMMTVRRRRLSRNREVLVFIVILD